MLTLRTAVSDADLERWRFFLLAVGPGKRADSVAEMLACDTPARLLLLAEEDGVLAGSGIADDSSLTGGFVAPRVLPEARRRGVGSALLIALARQSLPHVAHHVVPNLFCGELAGLCPRDRLDIGGAALG